MINTVIIADDLTGANDTGAILAQNGFKVGTILKTDHMEQFEDYDVLCISTNSRGISGTEAYARVQEAAALFPRRESILYSKRVDSTLRGNVGAEIDSILDYLGEDYRAVVVASFPGSGRTCIGDILLVNEVPLQMTEVAKDPTAPVHTSRVTEIIRQQSRHSVGYIGLEKVLESSGKLLEQLLETAKQNRIIVMDARTVRDIEAIAACCAASGLKIAAIDPGSFTAALAGNLFKHKKEAIQKKLLCGLGSASDLTRQQLQYLKKIANPLVVRMNAGEFFRPDRRAREMERVKEAVLRSEESHGILVITTTESKEDVLDLSRVDGAEHCSKKECAGVITDTIAQVLYDLVQEMDGRVGGVYASGGDVAAAFCEKLGISGFNVKGEVIPLAIYSNTIGGAHEGLPMITKGGLVGREDTLLQCMEYFETVI